MSMDDFELEPSDSPDLSDEDISASIETSSEEHFKEVIFAEHAKISFPCQKCNQDMAIKEAVRLREPDLFLRFTYVCSTSGCVRIVRTFKVNWLKEQANERHEG